MNVYSACEKITFSVILFLFIKISLSKVLLILLIVFKAVEVKCKVDTQTKKEANFFHICFVFTIIIEVNMLFCWLRNYNNFQN